MTLLLLNSVEAITCIYNINPKSEVIYSWKKNTYLFIYFLSSVEETSFHTYPFKEREKQKYMGTKNFG